MKKLYKKIIGAAAGLSVSFPGPLITAVCDNLKIRYPKYLYNLDLSMNTGFKTIIHEYGHVGAIKLLWKPDWMYVYVSGLEHLKKGKLYEWITGKDYCGYVWTWFEPDEPCKFYIKKTPLGDMLGDRNSTALISGAGAFAEMGAYISMYLLGRRAGDERPTLSTALKAFAFSWYVGRTNYPLTAALMNEKELREAAAWGHDWAKFSTMTGIDPKITLAAYLLFFPGLMAGLHLKDRYYKIKHDKREALERLVEGSYIQKKELENLFESYTTVPDFRFLKNRRLKGRIKNLEKFGIKGLGDYETELFKLGDDLDRERNILKKFRLKSKRRGIENEHCRFKDYVISDKNINAKVETERELYGQLCKKISEFEKNPKKTVEYFCKKYNIDSGHSDELIQRFSDFYDGETCSASKVFEFGGK